MKSVLTILTMLLISGCVEPAVRFLEEVQYEDAVETTYVVKFASVEEAKTAVKNKTGLDAVSIRSLDADGDWPWAVTVREMK